MRSRVIPGSSVTIERRVPVSRLNSVDLPTLGRPTITIDGSFSVILWTGSDWTPHPETQRALLRSSELSNVTYGETKQKRWGWVKRRPAGCGQIPSRGHARRRAL